MEESKSTQRMTFNELLLRGSSILLGYGSLAFLVGGIQTFYYFEMFDARWLLSQIEPQELLFNSVSVVVGVAFLGSAVLARTWAQPPRQRTLKVVGQVSGMVALLLVMPGVLLRSYWILYAAVGVTTLFLGAWTSYAWLRFKMDDEWKRGPLGIVGFAGLVLIGLPSLFGMISGLLDVDPQTSSLSHIELEDGTSLRLLQFSWDGVIAVKLEPEKGAPRVYPIEVQRVRSLRGGRGR